MTLERIQGGAAPLEQQKGKVTVPQPVFRRALLDMLCREEVLISRLRGLQQHIPNIYHHLLAQGIPLWSQL
jgi:hypothetical protein